MYEEQNISTVELSTSGGSIRMGVLTGDGRFLKGRISCMQVYNKALTEREVRAVRGLCFHKGLCTVMAIHRKQTSLSSNFSPHRRGHEKVNFIPVIFL